MEWRYGTQQVPWLLSDACLWCVRLAGWPNCTFNYFWGLFSDALFLPWVYYHHSISAVHDSRQNSILHVLDDAWNLSASTGLYVQFFCIPHGLKQPSAFFFTTTPGTVITMNMGTESISEMLEHFSLCQGCLPVKISQNTAFVFRQNSLCICVQKCKSYRLPKRLQI